MYSSRVSCSYCGRSFKSALGLEEHTKTLHGQQSLDAAADPPCGECGATAVLVMGKAVYSHLPEFWSKKFWQCPRCLAHCGCYGVTERPMGFPAHAPTRRARMAAHEALDPLWRQGVMERSAIYAHLAKTMKLEPGLCHVGRMNAQQAWQVVRICEGLWPAK